MEPTGPAAELKDAVGSGPVAAGDPREHVTRAGVAWAATVVALALLALMIVSILQNQDPVRIQYLGLAGSLPLGMALFIAAVGGGVLVAIAGAVRITQLRIVAKRVRRRPAVQQAAKARNQVFCSGTATTRADRTRLDSRSSWNPSL